MRVDVRKALAAFSRITTKGNRVAFGPLEEDNYIQHVNSGQRMQMRKKGVCPEAWAKEFETTKLKEGDEMTLVSANGGKKNRYGRRKVTFEAAFF